MVNAVEIQKRKGPCILGQRKKKPRLMLTPHKDKVEGAPLKKSPSSVSLSHIRGNGGSRRKNNLTEVTHQTNWDRSQVL